MNSRYKQNGVWYNIEKEIVIGKYMSETNYLHNIVNTWVWDIVYPRRSFAYKIDGKIYDCWEIEEFEIIHGDINVLDDMWHKRLI
jgi:hypothetical protein